MTPEVRDEAVGERAGLDVSGLWQHPKSSLRACLKSVEEDDAGE
jgi:hypothetical protein